MLATLSTTHNILTKFSTSVSAQPHLCSTSSQHLLIISCHSCSTINIILATNNWSFLSMHFTLSLESISSQSLYLWLASSYAHHIIFLCSFSILIIHNSYSFTPGFKPTHFFHKSFQPYTLLLLHDCLHGVLSGSFLRFLFLGFLFFCFWFHMAD